MRIEKFTKGALVYLPAGVKLYQHGGDEDIVVTRYKVTSKPAHVLFSGDSNHEYYKILFEGENWHVPNNDVYPLRGASREY